MKTTDSQPPRFAPPVRGRAALDNPVSRFDRLDVVQDAEAFEAMVVAGEQELETQIRTTVYKEKSRSIISQNDSPDIGMETTINPYRGCEHGCIYCYARPSHEYLGLSAGIDFETKIFVKSDAAVLLAEKLRSKSWQPAVITLSGITDPYQPLERDLKITRSCFEVLRDFNNPAAVITKNFLVTRDIDIFQEMAAQNKISISMSITTLDPVLARRMEPRTSRPDMRLKAVEMLARADIPVNIMMGPVVPGLTDHEIPAILKSAADAGASSAHYTMLRLPYGVKDLFYDWLHEHYPDRADKVLNRLRSMRGGKLYDSQFGTRMRGEGVYADQIAQVFDLYRRKYGLCTKTPLSVDGFNRYARDAQFDLFR